MPSSRHVKLKLCQDQAMSRSSHDKIKPCQDQALSQSCQAQTWTQSAAKRGVSRERLRGARALYGRRRRLLGAQPACTSPRHIRIWTRLRFAMAGSPSVGTIHTVELSRTPRRRLSRGRLRAQGQVVLRAQNRQRIASPPAYASPVHPSRRIRCQLVMRAARTGRWTTRIALRAGRRELGAREPIKSGRTPPRSLFFT